MSNRLIRTNSGVPVLVILLLIILSGSVPVHGQSAGSPADPPEENGHPSFTAVTVNCVDGVCFRASSTLDDETPYDRGTYGMQTLFDGDASTGWSEGVDGPGIGEVLWIGLPPGSGGLLVRNGFARSPRLFAMNNRVQEALVSLWDGVLPDGMVSEWTAVYFMTPLTETEPVYLEDTMDLQRISLPVPPAGKEGTSVPAGYEAFAATEGLPPMIHEVRRFVRLEIAAVYPGSRWDDTCLTDVIPVSGDNIPPTDNTGSDR